MRSSLIDGDGTQKPFNQCGSCLNYYTRGLRRPIIVCSMGHTVCQECFDRLRTRPICPFCHAKINQLSTTLNTRIYHQLPSEEVSANPRYVDDISNNHRIYEGNSSVAGSRPYAYDCLPSGAIGNPIQSSSIKPTAGYLSPPTYQGEVRQNALENKQQGGITYPGYQNAIQNGGRPNQDNGGRPYQDNGGVLSNGDEKMVLIFMFLQLPFAFLNLFFALSSPPSICMDQSQGISFLVLRPWLLAMGLFELILVSIILLSTFIYKTSCILYDTLDKIFTISTVALTLKCLLWSLAELLLFIQVISSHCSGGIFIYGIILLVLNCVVILAVCAFLVPRAIHP